MRAPSLVLVPAALAAALAVLVPTTPASAQDDLLTRAERTGFVETSRYEDVVDLSRALADADPRIHLTWFGYTLEGRRLPLLVIGDVPDPSPEGVRSTGRTRVYLQGNIHGGEVCGKEALLMLARGIVRDEYPAWTDSLVLLVAPIYNADGNERILLTNRPRQHGPTGGMGQRANAQGYDLNRDHMKLDSPEARSLVRLMTGYDPHVAVDLHTTNGTRHAYHLTYSPPLHPATPQPIVSLLREEWLPSVTRAVREKHGWEYYYYGNAYRPEGADAVGWYTFDHRPRFNNNYAGLRNRFAILSEAYAYATFRDRVLASLRFVEEILGFAHAHAGRIRRTVERADATSIVGERLPVRAVFEASDGPVEILMGAVREERHPHTGELMLHRTDQVRPTPMTEYGTFRGTAWERVPGAYLLPPGTEEIRERLGAHGVQARVLESERRIAVEAFAVDSTRVAERPFQGRRERTVWGAWGPAEERTLPAGTLVVPAHQPLGRLAVVLLEPRSDDGFLNWGFFDRWVEEEGTVPLFRVSPGVLDGRGW